MKTIIQHERLGEITYEEGFWTGKKSLSIDGQKLEKVDKRAFRTRDGQTVTLKGNFLYGVKCTVGAETVELSPACKWYEYVLALLPILLVIIWGNSKALCEIVPIVGGAIGGAIGGLFFALNLILVKRIKSVLLKIVVAICMLGACFLICYLIALIILAIV